MAAKMAQDLDVDELLAQRLISQGVHRGEFSRLFEKDGLARWHRAAEAEYQLLVDEEPLAPRFYKVVELERVPEPLESLEKMDISGLEVAVLEDEKGTAFGQHLRYALYGRLCVPAFKTGGVHTVLEDSSGRAVPVVIHHIADAREYPVGMEVAIKQPCFMTLTQTDRCVGVMVDNPANVVNLGGAPIRVSVDSEEGDAAAVLGCSDYIGPVEIRVGAEEHNRGRRGLFATRDVADGEVLLETMPLAVGDNRRKLRGGNMWGLVMNSSMDRLVDRLIDPTVAGLMATLVRLVQDQPRCAHQLHSLAVAHSPSSDIPPIALFDSSSRQGRYQPLSMDVGRIRQAILTNAFIAGDQGLGLWTLPSFLNHDCDPNCKVGYDEGEVQVIRASSHVSSGGELTVPYFDTYRTWFYRRRKAVGSYTWRFACSCPRCVFEERLSDSIPRFRDVSKQWHDLYEAHLFDTDIDGITNDDAPAVNDPSHATVLKNEVENMLQMDPRCEKMSLQQRDWIRRSFSRTAVCCAYSTSTSRRGVSASVRVRPVRATTSTSTSFCKPDG